MAFADWLFASGDYARAAGEYLKAGIIEGDAAGDYISYRIAKSYLRAGDLANAEKYLLLFMDRFTGSAQFYPATYDLAFVYFKTGKYDDSIRVLSFLANTSPELRFCAGMLQAVDLCLLGDFGNAESVLGTPGTDAASTAQESKGSMYGIVEKAINVEKKSPVAAGIFSAIIPGLGKMYADRLDDGLFSLVTIGAFAGLAAWGFYEDGLPSVRGWIYTAIGSVFYVGNIYGSVMAAIIYNREKTESLEKEVKSIGDSLAQ